MALTPNCNLSPEKRNKEILNVLSSVSSKSDLRDFTTPQGMAYEFITEDDRAQLCPDDDNLIQRYVAAVLYYSTEGDGWTECFEGDRDCGEGLSYYGGKEAFLSEDSECDWAGLTCNRSGELERIELCKYILDDSALSVSVNLFCAQKVLITLLSIFPSTRIANTLVDHR